MSEIELCCECDQPTGNAGRGDGSHYAIDDTGPYCWECFSPYQIDAYENKVTELEQQLADAYLSVTIVTEKLAKAEAKLTERDNKIEGLVAALEVIADNTSGENWQEAAPIAEQALTAYKEGK